MNLSRFSINQLHWIFTALALLFAAWISYIQHGWINNDSPIYFESARLFALGEWNASMEVWRWPLFPLLIAGIHKLSGLDIQLSAQVLNTLLFGLTAASFLQLIREAGGQKAALISGGLLLLSSQYIVGDILAMLLRDQGFWAFFLTSLVFFVRHAKHYRLGDALLWQACIIIATLFRIEGITYLVLLPLALLRTAPTHVKLKALLHAHSLNIVASIGLLVSILILGLKVTELGRLQEILTLDIYQQLTQKLFTQANIMAESVLGEYLDKFAVPSLLISFIFIIIIKTFSTTGTVNTILALFAIASKPPLIEQPTKTILNTVILISLINMFLIITKVFVLSGRYIIALTLILMVYAAFYMIYLFDHYKASYPKNRTWRITLWIVPISILVGLFTNLWPKPAGFNHEQDAIRWLNKHHVDTQEVFFDSARLRYYAGLPYNGNLFREGVVLNAIKNQQIITAPYVVLVVSGKHAENQDRFEETYPDYTETIRFYSPKNRKATIIYKESSGSKNIKSSAPK